jgi:ribosomal protein S12 methylthiotransferase
MPEIALRTTFIAGFPGETAAHFDAVLRLMAEVRFDHVGVFPYYPEEGTPAASLPGQVADRVKQRRKASALALQQGISLERNRALVGREVEVLVEGEAESPRAGDGGLDLIGRTYRDAPEVDGFVVFRGTAGRGDLVRVMVDAAGPYDLFGRQIDLDLPPAPAPSPRRRGVRSLPVLQPR